jgi:hypothetical protein
MLCFDFRQGCRSAVDVFNGLNDALMCSMAVCDIAVVVVAWLLYSMAALYNEWIFGSFMCRLLTFGQPMTCDSSMWTIAIVSIDRYNDDVLCLLIM